MRVLLFTPRQFLEITSTPQIAILFLIAYITVWHLYIWSILLVSCVSRFSFYKRKGVLRPTSAFVWTYALVKYKVELKNFLKKTLHHRYLIYMSIQSPFDKLHISKSKMIIMILSALQKVVQTVISMSQVHILHIVIFQFAWSCNSVKLLKRTRFLFYKIGTTL